MMVCNSASSTTLLRLIPNTHHFPPPRIGVQRILKMGPSRGISVVTKAGPPSTTSYLFAFIFPLSLLVGTAFTSIRISDKLDQKFIEELAVNQAILEGEEGEEGEEYDDQVSIVPSEDESPPVRKRNRPKRQVEVEPSSR